MELTPRLQLSGVEEADDTELDYIGAVARPNNEKLEGASGLIAHSSAEEAKSLPPPMKELGESKTTAAISKVGSADNPQLYSNNADIPPLLPPTVDIIQVSRSVPPLQMPDRPRIIRAKTPPA